MAPFQLRPEHLRLRHSRLRIVLGIRKFAWEQRPRGSASDAPMAAEEELELEEGFTFDVGAVPASSQDTTKGAARGKALTLSCNNCLAVLCCAPS